MRHGLNVAAFGIQKILYPLQISRIGTGGTAGTGGTGGTGGGGGCHDDDSDGYTTCENDCQDGDPAVNPGAFDFPNAEDHDCDGVSDNPAVACGAGLAYDSSNPLDYAKALDICQTTTEGATGAGKIWGLISAQFRLADGTGVPIQQQHSIITDFGSVIDPQQAQNFVMLSSGLAATPGQPYWLPETPQTGTDTGTGSASHPGFPTNKENCPLPTSSTAFNPVNLRLRLRTPTNAASFAF